MDGYIERMQAKENQCLALIQQADQVLEANGFQPSKEECVFLRKQGGEQKLRPFPARKRTEGLFERFLRKFQPAHLFL